MARLTQDQLSLLTEINGVRLALTEEFKRQENPSSDSFLRELLKLEVLMMENKSKEHLG